MRNHHVQDDSTESDPDQRAVANILADVEAGRLTLEAAAAAHPKLSERLRDMDAVRRLLWAAQEESVPTSPQRIDEFEILGIVGRGGMGVVYRARHPRLDRVVALKTIKPTHVDERSRRRFLREQNALARLHQTHIVPIYAAGCDGPIEYFVMPYIEGASLSDVLRAARKEATTKHSGASRTLSDLVQAARSAPPKSSPDAGALPATRPWTPSRQEPESADHSTTNGAAAPAPPNTDPAYFRSVAEAVAAAAEALEHAHRKGVFHRDLKPHNIMVAEHGHVWIIDFGLASLLGRDDELHTPDPTSPEREPLTRAAIGTYNYMAPEQFRQQADARTDVWGLGVTLYEMLTLQRAFPQRSLPEAQQAIVSADPPAPSSLLPAIPRDLDAICHKAIAKSPAARYQSARDFAADLRRFLRADPVAARPRPLRERIWRWARAHRQWSLLIVFLAVAVSAIIGLLAHIAQKARAELAEQHREVIMRDLDKILHSEKKMGWSKRALAKITQAAAIRPDGALRDAAVAALSGADVDEPPGIEIGASSVAYSPDGKWIVLGGTSERGAKPAGVAHLWRLDEKLPTPGEVKGAGLVTFRKDGTPVQLIESRRRLRLLNVMTGAPVDEFSFSPKSNSVAPPTMALAPAGDRVALSFPDVKETLVWRSGDPNPRRLPVAATAAAFSRDGALLALGTDAGETSVWSAGDGQRLKAFALFPRGVERLAFSPRVASDGNAISGDLAVGGNGRCGVADLASGRLACLLQYGEVLLTNLDFAPDGATVVANGRLYDAGDGRALLNLAMPEVFAFSPDGRELCSARGEGFFKACLVRQPLRSTPGLSLLHGLSSVPTAIALTPDGSVVAALAHDWTVAAWDVRTGRLLFRSSMPEGLLADNSAVAVSDDGKLLAAVSGHAFFLWEIDSGHARVNNRSIVPGLCNKLAFLPGGGLRLVRCELKSPIDYPVSWRRSSEFPRVIRGYDLMTDPDNPLYTVQTFPAHCYGLMLSQTGDRFVAGGRTLDPVRDRSVGFFDARTGVLLHQIPIETRKDFCNVKIDPLGRIFVAEEVRDERSNPIVLAANGGEFKIAKAAYGDPGSGGELWLANLEGASTLMTRSGKVLFGLRHFPEAQRATFSRDGRRLAFSTGTGAVALLDIPAMTQQLDRLGLREAP